MELHCRRLDELFSMDPARESAFVKTLLVQMVLVTNILLVIMD